MPSTTLARDAKRREAGVNVTVELFQLSVEPADNQGTCGFEHEEKSPVWKGGHLRSLNQHLPISGSYRMT